MYNKSMRESILLVRLKSESIVAWHLQQHQEKKRNTKIKYVRGENNKQTEGFISLRKIATSVPLFKYFYYKLNRKKFAVKVVITRLSFDSIRSKFKSMRRSIDNANGNDKQQMKQLFWKKTTFCMMCNKHK